MNQLISDLNWRYAVKKYDPTKKITDENMAILKEAVQLSASSTGLQAYQVLDIRDKAIREKLKAASFMQEQITDASHLFIFTYFLEVEDAYIDKLISNASITRNVSLESLSGYKNLLTRSANGKSTEARNNWLSKQTYIALGNLMQTAAHLRIDTTPMEGFDVGSYNEILGLKEKNLSVSVICALGYRSEDDTYQFLKKVRKPIDELFIKV